MGTLETFGLSEWLRFAFAILCCVPVAAAGIYCFRDLENTAAGKEKSARKKKDTI